MNMEAIIKMNLDTGLHVGSLLSSIDNQPRGLKTFIADIRNCKNKDEESKRVDKELGNIRKNFAKSSSLGEYDKRKYVWKMCYIHMLGYDVDFGHMEMISLLSSTRLKEKLVGYMAVSLIIRPQDEMMTLVVNSMRNDILSNMHYGQVLALAAIANIGNIEIAEAIANDVQRILVEPPIPTQIMVSGNAVPTPPEIRFMYKNQLRKKGSLCLLRLFRSNPELIESTDAIPQIVALLEDHDFGVLISMMSLVYFMACQNPQAFEVAVPLVVNILNRAVIKLYSPEHTYQRVQSPWLQAKCFRFLGLYQCPFEPSVRETLNEVLRKILIRHEANESAGNVNRMNVEHAIIFEAIRLMVHYGLESADKRLYEQSMVLLGRFVAGRDANIRYIALDVMVQLARQDGPKSVQEHQLNVLQSLKDADVSVRKRALELLFLMSDMDNAATIVEELLLSLPSSDPSIKEDILVKVAVLAEQFAGDMTWYLDTMVQAITLGGDYVSEDIWFRVVQVVMNPTIGGAATDAIAIQEYAASKLLQVVRSRLCYETAVALGAYILGEYGVHICQLPESSGYDQFEALSLHFNRMSIKTQAILLTTYAKLFNLYPDTREPILEVFRKLSSSGYVELQQRSCEYLQMAYQSSGLVEMVFEAIPPFPPARTENNPLMARLQGGKGEREEKRRSLGLSEDGVSSDGGSPRGAPSGLKPLPVSVAKPQAQEDLLDLMYLDSAGPSVGTSAPLVSHSISSYISSPRQNSTFGLSPDDQNTIHILHRALLLSTQPGPIYDGSQSDSNSGLKILFTTQGEFKGGSGKVMVGFVCSGLDVISDLVATVLDVDGFSHKVLRQPNGRVEPGQPASRLELQVDCTSPFVEFPSISISFLSSGRPFQFKLQLPISVCNFADPVSGLDQAGFMTRWNALEGDEREAHDSFTSAQPLSTAVISRLKETIFPVLHIGLVSGIDQDNTATGCFSIRAHAPDGGSGTIAIGVLFRLEGDLSGNRFQITVRAKTGTAALAVKNLFRSLFG